MKTSAVFVTQPAGKYGKKLLFLSGESELKRLFNSVWHGMAHSEAVRASDIDFTITVANDIIHTHVSL